MMQVQHLTRQFDKRGIAGLHGLSFNLDQGQVMGIMGPNGSGKTTLLKILSGAIKQDFGSIRLSGSVSLFSQSEPTVDINVQKLLVTSIKLDIDEDKKIQLARDLADTFDFTFQLKQNFFELSTGQKQKILLAQELINHPTLLLLDEPFSHLDPFTRKDILKALFLYIRNKKITVLWVTHDLEDAFLYSDLIALMQFGKFEQIGSPLEIVRHPESLFVAKFVGYQNFFPVKSPAGFDEILIVPDHAWEINSTGKPYKVENRSAGKQTIKYELSHESRSIYLIRGSQLPLLEVNEVVLLSPVIQECFSIPL